MKPQYYYIRIFPLCRPDEFDRPCTWHPCTEERARKRRKAACDQEAFNNYVAVVTETETDITVQEAFEGEIWNWTSPVILTLRKDQIFGDSDEAYRAQVALKIFEDAMDVCIDMATAQ